MTAPLKTQPMKDVSRALRLTRRNALAFHINPEQVAVSGFSAGGHLCGSMLVHYGDVTEGNELYRGYSNRPDAAILAYPVITTGEKTHRDSVVALLGANADEADKEYMSLEKHVGNHVPPVFLWQTVTDEGVPVENSYLFAEACRKSGVVYEHHVFSSGVHGLSLANAVWASGQYGGHYTLRQLEIVLVKN